MYVWLDIVGREEKRIKRLQPLQRIALAVACIDHAFSVMDEYLAAYVPKQSLGMAKQAIEALWEFLAASKKKKAHFSDDYADELQTINPGEDDPVLAPGWGQILDAILRACDMARGEDTKELIMDCLGYAYQGVMEMAIKLESKGAKTTERALRYFEKTSPHCAAEMRFQLECLHALEPEGTVESALFGGRCFPS